MIQRVEELSSYMTDLSKAKNTEQLKAAKLDTKINTINIKSRKKTNIWKSITRTLSLNDGNTISTQEENFKICKEQVYEFVAMDIISELIKNDNIEILKNLVSSVHKKRSLSQSEINVSELSQYFSAARSH